MAFAGTPGIDPDLASLRAAGLLARLPTQFRAGTPLDVRLWSEVEVAPGGCWDYARSRNAAGYGTIRVAGKCILAHRLAWELVVGSVPRELCVCHLCDRPSCCRPSHLWLGTRNDNNADKKLKGRARGLVGEANNQAKLTERQVLSVSQMRTDGLSDTVIAGLLGVSRGCIWQIHSGGSWSGLRRRA